MLIDLHFSKKNAKRRLSKEIALKIKVSKIREAIKRACNDQKSDTFINPLAAASEYIVSGGNPTLESRVRAYIKRKKLKRQIESIFLEENTIYKQSKE